MDTLVAPAPVAARPALCPRCAHPLERIEVSERGLWPLEEYLCPACRARYVAGPQGCTAALLRELT